MSQTTELKTPAQKAQWFTTTHWSVVLAAKSGESTTEALEKLCRTYRPPLYAFIRREGYGEEDAQDLTQEFLSRFIHREWLNHLQDRRGKFRSFLLTFLKNFLSDQRDRANAQKRRGGEAAISLDACDAAERDALEPANHLTPDQVYERQWAHTVMAAAVATLREEYLRKGKAALFEQLKDLQPGEHGERSYAELGSQLGMSEQAFKNAVHSFRRRHREILRIEIAQTVCDPNEVDEEIRHLMSVF
jgi:RNA polymerase sigma-70 factor (ECF subfamily)